MVLLLGTIKTYHLDSERGGKEEKKKGKKERQKKEKKKIEKGKMDFQLGLDLGLYSNLFPMFVDIVSI